MLDFLDLARHLPEMTVAGGTEIFVEGVRHHELLILLDGAVLISKSGVQISMIDEPGAILGKMAALATRHPGGQPGVTDAVYPQAAVHKGA